MPKNIPWRKVGPLAGPPYAEMVSEVLKDRDIPHYLSQTWFSAAYGVKGLSGYGNDTFIFVPEERVEEVERLIEEMGGGMDEPDRADEG